MNGFTEIAMSGNLVPALLVSVLAGIVSFASPCVVPLVPGYLSYLAAVVGVDEDSRFGSRGVRLRVAGAAGLFILGFTVVFLMGTIAILGLTSTVIGNQLLLQRIGARRELQGECGPLRRLDEPGQLQLRPPFRVFALIVVL